MTEPSPAGRTEGQGGDAPAAVAGTGVLGERRAVPGCAGMGSGRRSWSGTWRGTQRITGRASTGMSARKGRSKKAQPADERGCQTGNDGQGEG